MPAKRLAGQGINPNAYALPFLNPFKPQLLDLIAEVRKSGISYDRGETLEGISTMAFALDTLFGRFSVSLLVPTARFLKNEAHYREEMLTCKEALVREIGKIAAVEG